MLEATAFTYALIASFVMQSTVSNTRKQRPHGRAILLAGRLLMSMSFVLAMLLLGWLVLQLAGYLPPSDPLTL